MQEESVLHLYLTKNQVAALFITLKNQPKLGRESGLIYQQLEKHLYEKIGLVELKELEERYQQGEL
jgi:hypothetical protein